jgi:hypothetical protein
VVQIPHSHNSARRDLICRSVFSSFHDIVTIVVLIVIVVIVVSRLFITCAAFLAETVLSAARRVRARTCAIHHVRVRWGIRWLGERTAIGPVRSLRDD